MMRPIIAILMVFALLQSVAPTFAQHHLKGRVEDKEGPLEFVNVLIPSTGAVTISDTHGWFEFKDLPEGVYKIQASFVGYNVVSITTAVPGNEPFISILLEPSFHEMDEIVVTGTRTEGRRSESPVSVSVLNSSVFTSTQSNSLADGLNYTSGLRMETDCQTCGYSQLRMLGLGGAYSQILIDGRPIFNALMGLYGLEQIPVNIIDRIEIVKGGGSAIFGSSAIGGTVNVITRKPDENDISAGIQTGIIGGQTWDHSLQAAGTKVMAGGGVTLHAGHRNRGHYDQNDDGFSEMPAINSTNLGVSAYLKTGRFGKLDVSLRHIHEYRRGGNEINLPAHEADQSEERTHRIYLGSANFAQPLPNLRSSISFHISGQTTNRDHYTGIDHADAYGTTRSNTVSTGIQWNTLLEEHTLTFGTEFMLDDIYDQIPDYNYLVDQQIGEVGFYLQDEWKLHDRWTLLGGLRMDSHTKLDQMVASPRANLLFKPGAFSQLRASFSTGFRAPQAFDADLHIAFSGGGVAFVQLDPRLRKETSRSLSLSFNLDKPTEKYIVGFTADIFHTRLFNAFVLLDGGVDGQGNTVLIKSNGGNSTVTGINGEGRMNFNYTWQLDLGLTLQQSFFDEAVKWSEQLPGTREYLRTPNAYGYFRLGIYPIKRLNFDLTGIFTGPMYVPHFAGAKNVPADILMRSTAFFEQNLKVGYDLPILKSKMNLNLNVGIKNIFNAYQNDFDTGQYRDSNYIYGPAQPRTMFFGLSISSK